jgi:hypothetical protein
MADKEYYIATTDEHDDDVIYKSEKFKLSELDLINLIKICLVEQRNKFIGNKLKEAYIDSTEHRKEITHARLNLIGIKDNGNQKPEVIRKGKSRRL